MFPQPIEVGTTIDGKYVLERVLGQGGMGSVFAARHLQLGQLVAIKFPLSTSGSGPGAPTGPDRAAERVLREARAGTRIQSEHIVRIYDVGAHERAGPYLIMEYLVGCDLGAVLSQWGPLPVTTAVDYVLQACEALAEVHAKRIIHRDLKPSNLFLCRYPDGSPLIKVIDFGLAKSCCPDDEVALTRSGTMLGSPLYMPLEQMRGAADLDQRTDIWAIGATLYALLTGAPPFPGKSPFDVYDQIKRGPPSLTSACPTADPVLEQVLSGCLQAERSQRYSNVAELADALSAAAPEHGTMRAKRVRAIQESVAANEAESARSRRRVLEPALEEAPSPTAAARHASWNDAVSIGSVGTGPGTTSVLTEPPTAQAPLVRRRSLQYKWSWSAVSSPNHSDRKRHG